MNTSGQARKPRQRAAAEPAAPPSGSPPAGPDAMADVEETVPDASRPAGVSPDVGLPPDNVAAGSAAGADSHRAAQERPLDEAELRQEIERTREQLGETVEQLAAKADVTGKVRAQANDLAVSARRTAAQARTQAATRVSTVRGQLAGKTAAAGQKATAAGSTVKSQLQAKAAPVRESTPEHVRRAVARSAATAQQRRAWLMVAAVTLMTGYLLVRWWRKR